MDDGAVKTLFLPFEIGELPVPAEGARFLFLNAGLPPSPDQGWRDSLNCAQGFKPDFLNLQNAGYQVTPQAAPGSFSGGLVLLGKHRELNRGNIHAALERTLPGGPVLIGGAKTSGIQAMRKELAELLPVQQTLSKNHAQVFWCLRPDSWVSPPSAPKETISAYGMAFETASGMFSHKAADAGSQMLVPHFADVKGRVADFGAGWGFLSALLLKLAPGVTALDLFEADFASLAAARVNLAAIIDQKPTAFFWRDLLAEPVEASYDAIIMNPPFHSGRRAEVSIGQYMIAAAAKALKPRGRLLLVANRELPYEETLQRSFKKFERLDADRRYKILEARK